MLGIPEYWRFDPTGGEMFGQAVIGEQLVGGQYQRLPLLRYGGIVVGSTSPLLNLNFRYRVTSCSPSTTRKPGGNMNTRSSGPRALRKKTAACREADGDGYPGKGLVAQGGCQNRHRTLAHGVGSPTGSSRRYRR